MGTAGQTSAGSNKVVPRNSTVLGQCTCPRTVFYYRTGPRFRNARRRQPPRQTESARDEREDMSLIDDLVKLEEEAKELVAAPTTQPSSRLRALSCSAARAASPADAHDGQARPRGSSRDGQARQRDAPADRGHARRAQHRDEGRRLKRALEHDASTSRCRASVRRSATST